MLIAGTTVSTYRELESHCSTFGSVTCESSAVVGNEA
jgi:hypothetical protein